MGLFASIGFSDLSRGFVRPRWLLRVVALILGFCSGLASPALAQSDSTLRIGVAPHTSARAIFEMYQPLRTYLEKSLGTPVSIVTAPDFTEFARRMLNQEYDLAITTGHQARLAQTDGGYTPLLTYQADFRAVGLVKDKGPITTAADLKGKPIAAQNPSSLVTLWGKHWLEKSGLGNADIRYSSASDSVAQSVVIGEVAAGFVSLANYQSLPRDVQAQMRFLVIGEPLAGRVYVLNKRETTLREKLEAALWAFAATAEGKAYFEKYKLEGYRKLKPRELEAMDPFAKEVRQVLKSSASK